MSFNSRVSLFNSFPYDLYVGESGVVKPFTILVLALICSLRPNSVCFMKSAASVFGVLMFRIIMFYHWNFPSISIDSFGLKSISQMLE